MQLWTLAEEMRPRRLEGYEKLEPDAAAWLEARAQRLVDLTDELERGIDRGEG